MYMKNKGTSVDIKKKIWKMFFSTLPKIFGHDSCWV